VNRAVTISGSGVTDAYRFWFDNPTVDYGHGIRMAVGATQELKFSGWETALHDRGPVLAVTYGEPVTATDWTLYR
jgi:hypothetical protein